MHAQLHSCDVCSQIICHSHAGEQEVAHEQSDLEQLDEFDEIQQVVRCLVDEVVNTHSKAYSKAYWPLMGYAKHYNAIAWAVRSLSPYQQSLALDSAHDEWLQDARAMLALERANGADVMGPGFCQLRGSVSECKCSILCAVCGLPQWHNHCRLWRRGKCECRIVGVTPSSRCRMEHFSDAEVAEVWPPCKVSMVLREFGHPARVRKL